MSETLYRTIHITLSGEDENAIQEGQQEAVSRLGEGFMDFFDRTSDGGYHLRVSDELQPPPASNKQLAEWVYTLHPGSSSESILERFLGRTQSWYRYPSCISDFERCYNVLRICQIDIAVMRGASKEWDVLVAVWPQLIAYYEQWVETGNNKSINVLDLAHELASPA